MIRVENPQSKLDNGTAIVHVLDDMGHWVYARGLGDGLLMGIVLLMITKANPCHPLYDVLDPPQPLRLLFSNF